MGGARPRSEHHSTTRSHARSGATRPRGSRVKWRESAGFQTDRCSSPSTLVGRASGAEAIGPACRRDLAVLAWFEGPPAPLRARDWMVAGLRREPTILCALAREALPPVVGTTSLGVDAGAARPEVASRIGPRQGVGPRLLDTPCPAPVHRAPIPIALARRRRDLLGFERARSEHARARAGGLGALLASPRRGRGSPASLRGTIVVPAAVRVTRAAREWHRHVDGRWAGRAGRRWRGQRRRLRRLLEGARDRRAQRGFSVCRGGRGRRRRVPRRRRAPAQSPPNRREPSRPHPVSGSLPSVHVPRPPAAAPPLAAPLFRMLLGRAGIGPALRDRSIDDRSIRDHPISYRSIAERSVGAGSVLRRFHPHRMEGVPRAAREGPRRSGRRRGYVSSLR